MVTDRVGSSALGANMGVLTAARSVGIVISPLIGGVVYANAGYFAVFAVAFALLAADVVFRCLLIEAHVAHGFDPSITPALPPSPGMDSFQSHCHLDTTEKNAQDINTDSKIATFIQRLPPFITLLGSIRLLVGLWGIGAQAMIFAIFDAVIPLFVHRVFHWDSTGAGLVFLSIVIPTLTSPIIGWFADKHGLRWFVTFGFLLTMVPLILLRLVAENTLHDKIVLCILLAISSGMSMCFEIPLQIDIILAVEDKAKENPRRYGCGTAYAQAFGLSNVTFALGVILGPLWGSFAIDNSGWARLTLGIGVLAGLSAIPALIYTGGNIFTKRKQTNSRPGTADLPEMADRKVY
ncbi:hypothetical protein FQN57_000762 [Myotisia sp. PD_48]|nr:hypothetical protein FQN57_000762 [Myotisia sp. PD_48]